MKDQRIPVQYIGIVYNETASKWDEGQKSYRRAPNFRNICDWIPTTKSLLCNFLHGNW